MVLEINGTKQEFQENINLSQLIRSININTAGIAIAIDNCIIPKSKWEQRLLNKGEKITIIQATQGG